jgi:hypothetical protein
MEISILQNPTAPLGYGHLFACIVRTVWDQRLRPAEFILYRSRHYSFGLARNRDRSIGPLDSEELRKTSSGIRARRRANQRTNRTGSQLYGNSNRFT